MNYNYNYNQNQNAELVNFECKEIIRNNYASRLEASKLESRKNFQIETMKMKSLFKEAERQLQKAQVDVVKIRDDGTVIVETENLRVDKKARYVTNAESPSLTYAKKIGDENKMLFLFESTVNERDVFVFLKADGISDGSYLLRKLGSVGVCVFADTQSEKKNLIVNLMFCLRKEKLPTLFLPEQKGWYQDETGKIEFYDGIFTWKEALKCAR